MQTQGIKNHDILAALSFATKSAQEAANLSAAADNSMRLKAPNAVDAYSNVSKAMVALNDALNVLCTVSAPALSGMCGGARND